MKRYYVVTYDTEYYPWVEYYEKLKDARDRYRYLIENGGYDEEILTLSKVMNTNRLIG